MQEKILGLLFLLPALIVAFTVHEFAHAYAAYLRGDRYMARRRLTFNPLEHLDPLGTAMIIITYFVGGGMLLGWAKPVQVYLPDRKDMMMCALAGPVSNFILAAIAGIPFKLGLAMPELMYYLLGLFVSLNIGLGIFNLIPIPPLDGSKVLKGLLSPQAAYKMDYWEQANPMLLWGIFIVFIITPLSSIVIGYPYMFLMRLFTMPL